jgi:DNA-binding CsgD family transcriptional regulator/predicted negative regulator of RcsB-dependent stress response
MNISPAFELAAVASRSELQRALKASPVGSTAYAILSAIGQLYEGDVVGAVRTLRHALRKAQASERCEIADLLAPILVMRDRPEERDELRALRDVLESGGWTASARSFSAMLAAQAGERAEARRQHEVAWAALADEESEIVRSRVLQRLARVSFLLHDYDRALDLAASSGDLARRAGAWRVASAAYSILYQVHHSVTGDVLEADRCIRLCSECARKAEDLSFERAALVAEFEIAVQFGDRERALLLDRAIKSRLLPEQYFEQFAYVFSSALLSGGAGDLRAMRAILQILRDVPTRSRNEWSICTALIALAEAAEGDDATARRSFHAACAHLGRLRASDLAHERRYRRLARAVLCTVGMIVGDAVRARRILEVRESRGGEGEELLPVLTQSESTDEIDPRVRGIAAVLQHGWRERLRGALPADLTEAEMSVLALLGQGWSAGRIASETGRSVNTIYNHTRAILSKLDASRAAEAVARARTLGILR